MPIDIDLMSEHETKLRVTMKKGRANNITSQISSALSAQDQRALLRRMN